MWQLETLTDAMSLALRFTAETYHRCAYIDKFRANFFLWEFMKSIREVPPRMRRSNFRGWLGPPFSLPVLPLFSHSQTTEALDEVVGTPATIDLPPDPEQPYVTYFPLSLMPALSPFDIPSPDPTRGEYRFDPVRMQDLLDRLARLHLTAPTRNSEHAPSPRSPTPPQPAHASLPPWRDPPFPAPHYYPPHSPAPPTPFYPPYFPPYGYGYGYPPYLPYPTPPYLPQPYSYPPPHASPANQSRPAQVASLSLAELLDPSPTTANSQGVVVRSGIAYVGGVTAHPSFRSSLERQGALSN